VEKANRFCISCGAALSDEVKFCEQCGAPVGAGINLPPPVSTPIDTSLFAEPQPPSPPKKKTAMILAGIVTVFAIAVVLGLFILPGGSGSSLILPGQPVPTVTTPPPVTPAPEPVTTLPTPVPEPFPDALELKEKFPFGSGEIASEGTVYRVWMNDTYQWHNDMDNKYYPQRPGAGNKYLIVFVNVFNNASTRVWPPTSNNVRVYYDGVWYSSDPTHFLPNKAYDRRETPIEVKEIQYLPKLFGSEYVEDYGYSHGSQTAYLYPGKSNAIDGYIIYEVPSSLTLDKAYARIAFNGYDTAIWKLG
jgi:hypothetical protein